MLDLSGLLKKGWFLNAFVVVNVENADMKIHALVRLMFN